MGDKSNSKIVPSKELLHLAMGDEGGENSVGVFFFPLNFFDG
jgi:hypothetical protein